MLPKKFEMPNVYLLNRPWGALGKGLMVMISLGRRFGSLGYQRKRLPIASMMLGVATAAIMIGPSPASAQVARRNFDIPAQPLATAVTVYGQQAGVQISAPGSLLRGRVSGALKGSFPPTDALMRLLAGTGLTFRIQRETIILEEVPDAGRDALDLATLQIDGGGGTIGGSVINGVNGSHDATATENSGSYTTGAVMVGTKMPVSIKDTPASVSVITAQQIQDENLNDFTSLVSNLPGVGFITGTAGPARPEFYSRGFRLTRMQIDGGAPIDIGPQAYGMNPQIDPGLYDHAELLRGADGLFSGFGDPAGTINLVRKRPLDHLQVAAEGQYGSWDRVRASVDVTGPIAFDNKLRARIITVVDNRNFFYRIARSEKMVLSGALDFEVLPGTVVSGGVTQTWIDTVPWAQGLPRYINGDDLRLPRSTCLCVPWSRENFNTTEIYGRIESAPTRNVTIKLNATKLKQRSENLSGTIATAYVGIRPDMSGLRYATGISRSPRESLAFDGTVAGTFSLLGNEQQIVVGGSYMNANADGLTSFPQIGSAIGIAIPRIDTFDPYGPRYSPPEEVNRSRSIYYPYWRQIQRGFYVNLRLTPFKRLHVSLGTRYSYSKIESLQQTFCPTAGGCYAFVFEGGRLVRRFLGAYGALVSETRTPNPDGPSRLNGRVSAWLWPPVPSFAYDITKRLTAYGTYQKINQVQSNWRTESGGSFGPITGFNAEGGLKWAPNNGLLNVTLSGFFVKQDNFAVAAYPNDPARADIARERAMSRESKGLDFQVAGEVTPGWQVQTSYTFADTVESGDENYRGTVGDFQVAQLPKHTGSIWTTYQFAKASPLNGFNIGGGVNYVSKASYAGPICTRVEPSGCLAYSGRYGFTNPARAIVAIRMAYNIMPAVNLAVNIDNLLDKTYYQTVRDTATGNWYGEPRNIIASINARF